MRVLLIKTSSLGDIIHTFPALTDAKQQFPSIQFDWVVEKSFEKIPLWHPSVAETIPTALRRWRRQWKTRQTATEMLACLKQLGAKKYDVILDAQGLLKSAVLTLAAKGRRTGFSWSSSREKTASLFYQDRVLASWTLHAVDRLRLLFAKALHYPLPQTTPNYGIQLPASPSFFDSAADRKPYYVFLPYTTWPTKYWPIEYWILLAKRLEQEGQNIILLPNSPPEEIHAQQIAHQATNVKIFPRFNLEEAARVLSKATAVVTVDTGLGHLSAALGIPTVSIYGPTDPKQTGTVGLHQIHLAADFPCAPCLSKTCRHQTAQPPQPPCFAQISPDQIFERLQQFKQNNNPSREKEGIV